MSKEIMRLAQVHHDFMVELQPTWRGVVGSKINTEGDVDSVIAYFLLSKRYPIPNDEVAKRNDYMVEFVSDQSNYSTVEDLVDWYDLDKSIQQQFRIDVKPKTGDLPATDKQINFLLRKGWEQVPITRITASQLISRIIQENL